MPKAPRRSMRPMMRPEPEENTSRALTGEMVRPMMRPLDKAEEFEVGRAIERGNRQDPGPSRLQMELESPSMRPQMRPAKKFADGGMVRGCKPGQMSGKKFSGTF